MTMPNFFVIGAPRAGTSTLYAWLAEHPQVFLCPVKEPKYFQFADSGFDFDGPGDAEAHALVVTTRGAYEALFAGAGDRPAVGEASPGYLHCPRAAAALKRTVPGARCIAVLRDPAERAYSNYLHMVQGRRETIPGFRAAVEEGRSGRRDSWDSHWRYFEVGLYHDQVKRYLDAFGRERVLLHLHEDLESDPAGFLRRTQEFLGVAPRPLAATPAKHNAARVPRSNALRAAIEGDGAMKRLAKRLVPAGARRAVAGFVARRNVHRPELPAADRRWLVGLYREDVLRLQDLIGRDLSAWTRA